MVEASPANAGDTDLDMDFQDNSMCQHTAKPVTTTTEACVLEPHTSCNYWSPGAQSRAPSEESHHKEAAQCSLTEPCSLQLESPVQLKSK